MQAIDFELSVEQEFHVKSIELSSDHLSREELQEALVEFTRQLLVKENVIRHLVKTITLGDIKFST